MNWTMQWLLILLLVLVTEETTANSCCPDGNAVVLQERRCSSHEEKFSFFHFSLNCSGSHFHILYPHEFTIRREDNALIIGQEVKLVIPTGKYCIASILEENTTIPTKEDSAILCFPIENSSMILNLELLVYTACVLLSAIMLFITFILYLLVPKLMDLQGKCLMSTVICQCLAYTSIAFVLLQVFHYSSEYCVFQALFTYFCMLASCFWMNIVSFNIWRKTVFRRFPVSEKYLLIIYCAFGWGVPFIFLTVAAVTHFLQTVDDEEGFEDTCWYDGPVNMVYYFALPVGVLTCLNILYFVWAGCKLWSGTDQSQSAHKIRSLKNKCLLYLKMFVVMGMPWALCILSSVITDNMVIMVTSNVAILLQGFFIFLVLVLFRKRALRGLVERFHCRYCPQSWTAGEDHEDSEAMIPEEVELSQTTS